MCLKNNKILYCDSRGDKRFSALYAKVNLNGIIDSIENHYQNCKRDELGNIPGKGKPVSYMVYKDKKLPASKLSDFYKYLWKLYFIENPDLLEYASKFDEFIDRFKGKAINCQADVIKELVLEYIENTQDTKSSNGLVTVCGTGHRPSALPAEFGYDYHSSKWTQIINQTKEVLKQVKATNVISGMALGFDTALAIATLQLQNEGFDIKLEAAIPCKGQASKWNSESQYLYSKILERCYKKIYLSDRYTNTCMQDRNVYMVDNSDIVLALYKGTPGGTANCINYAKSKGKKIINLLEGVNFSTTPSMNSHIKINNEEEKNMQDIISLLKLNEEGDSYVLDITHIKPDMCTTKQKNKFFMFENKTLTKFFYEINEEDYTKYVSYLKDNKRKVKKENLVFETASTYFKNKARLAIVKMYFGIPNSFNNLPVEVDFRGMWSKSIAKYGDENQYTAYQEDEYRENDNLNEIRAKNAYELYIKEYPRSQALDEDIKAIIEELYNTIIKATQKRLIMCLDLESVLNNILNIIEYSIEGNITEFQYNSLKYSYKGLVNKLLNPDMQEFIKVHSDIDMFAEYEDTKVDYISTYQRVLRKLTAIYSDSLEYMKDIIHNEADILEDIILANDTELIYEDYRDNSQNEYDECLVIA